MNLHHFIEELELDPSLADERFHGYVGLNSQIIEFGLRPYALNNVTTVEKTILEIDTNFNLVMILERLPESLILLADKLCLPLFMMASLKLNERRESLKAFLSEDKKLILRKHQMPDEM